MYGEVQLRFVDQGFQSIKENFTSRAEVSSALLKRLHLQTHNSSSRWSFFQQVCLFPEETQKDFNAIRSLNNIFISSFSLFLVNLNLSYVISLLECVYVQEGTYIISRVKNYSNHTHTLFYIILITHYYYSIKRNVNINGT